MKFQGKRSISYRLKVMGQKPYFFFKFFKRFQLKIAKISRYRPLRELKITPFESACQDALNGTTFAYIGGGQKFDQNLSKNF